MTQSDLIILTFDQREDALWARRALEMMRAQHSFGLDHATEITRDGAGRTILHHRVPLPAYPHASHDCLLTLLSAAIFEAPQEDRHRSLKEAGLDEFFLQRVSQALVPNSSALLIFVPSDNGMVDLRSLLNVIALLRGTMHRTSVPAGIEQALRKHANTF